MGKGVKTRSGETVRLKTNFEVGDCLEPFYTGGVVQCSKDGQHMFCTCGSAVKVVQVETGRVEHSIEEESDSVTCFVASWDSEWLVVGWQSLLLRQYDWRRGRCTRTWKGHLGPVVAMACDPSSTLLATGSSDGAIKVWDCEKHYCTHNLQGSKGMVTLLRFHPSSKSLTLFSSSVDCAIRVWDLHSSRCVHVLEGHVSAVTSLGFAEDGATMLSGGRDKVVHVWELASGSLRKTFPIFEAIEGLVVVPGQHGDQEDPHFATAGEKGLIRFWDTSAGRMVSESNFFEGACPPAFTSLQYCRQLGVLVAVTYDHTLILYSIKERRKVKQFVGHLDEVLDVRFMGEGENLLAVATNSEQLKVFNRGNQDCQVLAGHAGIVLCLDASDDTLVSSSKDASIRVWKLDSTTQHLNCVAIGTGHTHAVGAVALSRLSGSFSVSGSQDCTIKMWDLRATVNWQKGNHPVQLQVTFTQLAHDKDINSLDVSPNDKLIVTGSQDKTAKLWRVLDGSLQGVFRGHRRGLWSVKFSPVDQCVATASADGTVKLWAVGDFSCIKTFEGHVASVLKAIFLPRGMQLVSSGSDGLVKVWTIRTNECVATLDRHTEKVWSLACSCDGMVLVSGSADSLICEWKDVTERVEEEEQAARDQQVLREQELSNLLQQEDYIRAVGLAITLDQPFRVLSILSDLLDEGGEEGRFSKTILALREDQTSVLLRYLSRWNMNARHCRVAQTVLSVVLQTRPPEWVVQCEGVKEIVEGLVPYTERHFQRLSRLLQLSMFVDYTWQCMKLPTVETSLQGRTPPDSTTPTPGENMGSIEGTEHTLHHHGNGEDHVTSTSDIPVFKKKKRKEGGSTQLLKSRRWQRVGVSQQVPKLRRKRSALLKRKLRRYTKTETKTN